MKMFKNYLSAMFLAGVAMFTIGCDDNEEIAVDPDAEYDVVLEVSDEDPDATANYTVTAETGESIDARVAFTSASDMKRLYITVNAQGSGEQLFEPIENIDLKADGSVDLTGKDDNDFEFAFELPVPDTITVGTLIYKFWTTTGNGDFRDVAQRNAVGPGTITITYGGSNPAAEVKIFTNLKLSAPAGDGTSLTFVSLLDGQVYTAKPAGTTQTQEAFEEYISFWDFGYINKTVGGPTLHSTSTYPSVAFPPATFPFWTTSTEPKNTCFFRTSTKTVAEFDAITTSAQLNFITKPTDEFVSNLAANTVIEFVDQYGKKGMIKVLEAVPGNSPTINFVRITIKVQP